ncbi:CHAT domain-containing protein [Fischerella muscicola]|nr:CHAT domain-containing protein [Fischerella muscicola]
MNNNTENQGIQMYGGTISAENIAVGKKARAIKNISKTEDIVSEKSEYAVKTILILAANPKTTPPLRLDEEVREIDTGLQRAKKRELFDLKQRWAVRVRDVYQSLLDFKPQIVHFSSHGAGNDGLALEDENGKVQLVSTEGLAELFKLFANQVECVLLNACYSEVQAKVIVQHIPYVIGMNKAIGDKAAIEFAVGFYNALAAGESIEFAYQLGCTAIRLAGIPEHFIPVLQKR